jgi:acylphosphatase
VVTREFEIVGENVVDTGVRPGLINKSLDYNVSVRASNLPDNRVRVIIDGDSDSITEFIDMIQKEDIRIKQATPKTYSLTELREYHGPEIDWNRDELRFLSKQVYKGFREANKRLSEIESRLKFMLMRT